MNEALDILVGAFNMLLERMDRLIALGERLVEAMEDNK